MTPVKPTQPNAICTGLTVLVADDFESMRVVMTSHLHTLGAKRIFNAANGAEALRVMKDLKVDLLFTDWNMPVMTGLDLLKAVRSDPKLCHIPVIMVTGESERERIRDVIANGVSALLLKPYSLTQLVERITLARQWQPRGITQPIGLASPPGTAPGTAQAMPNPSEKGAATSAAPATEAPQLAQSTLLLVDDTPDNLLLLSKLFRSEYRVRLASNGAKALEICTSDNPPDLVLLDIMMPDMDGFEVARRMRQHPMAENIPVIFVTAMTSADARTKGLELGAVDFVTKPIDPNVLLPRVRNFIRYVQLRKNLQSDLDHMVEIAHLRDDVERITRHDLKGPLAGVLGLLQGMIAQSPANQPMHDQLCLAEETTLQLLNMVNLSVELFKIEVGTYKLHAVSVPVADILQRIVQLNAVTFSEKHLRMSVQTEAGADPAALIAWGDAMLCYSMFENLIKNACEAAPNGSEVRIMLANQTPLRIDITNTGAVPPPVRERFFDKFVTHGKPSGTGLGTYSAKLLAKAQVGDISLAVNDDQDTTTLSITLPRSSHITNQTG